MLGSKRRAGTEHFIIRQLDRTLAPLPAWMAEPGQAALGIVGHPRIPVEGLADLRTLVDALMASCTGFRPLSRELAMKSARRKQGDLFEEIRVVELRPRAAEQADATAFGRYWQKPPDWSHGRPCRTSSAA